MKAIGVLMLAMGGFLLASMPLSQAATPGFGNLYYKGGIVRTVVPPAAFPNEGRDNFYAFPHGGAAGQLGVASVAPGAPDYHGGHWKFFAVTFHQGMTPYLLTSEDAVLSALNGGDVAVSRVSAHDFLCPIQP